MTPGAVNVDLTSHSTSGADGVDALSAVENVAGSKYADTLVGDGAANALSGGAGNDVIDGRLGLDSFLGDAGNDSITSRDAIGEAVSCGAGADSVIADALDTTPAADCETVTRP